MLLYLGAFANIISKSTPAASAPSWSGQRVKAGQTQRCCTALRRWTAASTGRMAAAASSRRARTATTASCWLQSTSYVSSSQPPIYGTVELRILVREFLVEWKTLVLDDDWRQRLSDCCPDELITLRDGPDYHEFLSIADTVGNHVVPLAICGVLSKRARTRITAQVLACPLCGKASFMHATLPNALLLTKTPCGRMRRSRRLQRRRLHAPVNRLYRAASSCTRAL